MELVNATRKAIDSGVGPADPAVREAAEAVAIMLSLVAPYTAEEMWERLGHEPTSPGSRWPEVDPALLVEESVTAVVQVQGKVRQPAGGRRRRCREDDLRAAALADPDVVRALDGREVRTVIVRAPKLVNIVGDCPAEGRTPAFRPCSCPIVAAATYLEGIPCGRRAGGPASRG